jgi:hypothetical protein
MVTRANAEPLKEVVKADLNPPNGPNGPNLQLKLPVSTGVTVLSWLAALLLCLAVQVLMTVFPLPGLPSHSVPDTPWQSLPAAAQSREQSNTSHEHRNTNSLGAEASGRGNWSSLTSLPIAISRFRSSFRSVLVAGIVLSEVTPQSPLYLFLSCTKPDVASTVSIKSTRASFLHFITIVYASVASCYAHSSGPPRSITAYSTSTSTSCRSATPGAENGS